MTREDIVRRIIKQGGCKGLFCYEDIDLNKGTTCPFLKDACIPNENSLSMAIAWAGKHGLSIPYSSTFTVEHRFKPGDRVQHKYDTTGPVTTVAEVVFTADCGAFYRFVEAGTPSGSVSYCDENLRLADCDNEAEKAKEMP